MVEYYVKVWHEHELMWQFITKDALGIYKSAHSPHIKNKASRIHPKVEAWAKDSDISMDEIAYAVIPLDQHLDKMRQRGKLF